jgi:hypothetical protein
MRDYETKHEQRKSDADDLRKKNKILYNEENLSFFLFIHSKKFA